MVEVIMSIVEQKKELMQLKCKVQRAQVVYGCRLPAYASWLWQEMTMCDWVLLVQPFLARILASTVANMGFGGSACRHIQPGLHCSQHVMHSMRWQQVDL